jgi:hypothetical protein
MREASWFALFLVASSMSAGEAAAQTEMRATRAIVFKNGLAFVTREGTLLFRDGATRVAPAPPALLGTLWIGAGGRVIDEVRAAKEERQTTQRATSIGALLEANTGKVATIRVGESDYTGTLLSAPRGDEATDLYVVASGGSVRADSLVLIRVEGRVHAFDPSSVVSVSFPDEPSTNRAVSTREVALSIRAQGPDGPAPVTMSYLRTGMSWVPEYSITLLDRERAHVTMQAALINDGEDLRDARIRFAVGFPNFAFAHVSSPMTLDLELGEFLRRLAQDPTDRSYGNVATQRVMMNAITAGADLDPVDVPAIGAGESVEDLFFYERPGVTLARGERAVYAILAQTVPFRHVYVWDVPAETDEARNSREKPAPDQVWHSIVLTNSGATPWTTAPALVLADGNPLAQDTLGYTAAGARGKIKVTIATDIAVEREEVEIDRKPNDTTRFGYTWAALTVEGTLTMRIFKKDAVTLSIAKTIEGATLSREPEGKVTRRVLQPKAVNPTERLEWEIPLAPGEKRTVKYRYKVWVRD